MSVNLSHITSYSTTHLKDIRQMRNINAVSTSDMVF